MSHAVAHVRGLGIVSALGVGVEATLAAADAGRTGFQGPREDRAAYPAPFHPRDLPRGLGRRLGRQLGMTLAAALECAGERAWSERPDDTALVLASAHGPMDETIDFLAGAARDGARYASPVLFSGAQHNAMVGVVSRALGLRGPATLVCNGEVSFETALLAAHALFRTGRVARALVAACDGFHPLYRRSVDALRLLAHDDLPIDPRMERTSRGYHLGEGAGAMLLEWAPRDRGHGVAVEEVRLGPAPAPAEERPPPDRVCLNATGDAASARRHAEELARIGAPGAEVAYPAALFGASGALSAIAAAYEAAQLARRPAGATRLVTAPQETQVASVLLARSGPG